MKKITEKSGIVKQNDDFQAVKAKIDIVSESESEKGY